MSAFIYRGADDLMRQLNNLPDGNNGEPVVIDIFRPALNPYDMLAAYDLISYFSDKIKFIIRSHAIGTVANLVISAAVPAENRFLSPLMSFQFVNLASTAKATFKDLNIAAEANFELIARISAIIRSTYSGIDDADVEHMLKDEDSLPAGTVGKMGFSPWITQHGGIDSVEMHGEVPVGPGTGWGPGHMHNWTVGPRRQNWGPDTGPHFGPHFGPGHPGYGPRYAVESDDE